MMTVEEITNRCKEICAGVGYDFTIPVIINKRLRTTLGRVRYIRFADGTIKNHQMEFSENFLKTSTPEEIDQVIKHECAHYLVNEKTKVAHHHDAVFKQQCAEIGCYEDAATNRGIEKMQGAAPTQKYSVFCQKCGKLVASYARQSKVTKNPGFYTSKCCGSGIKIIQNW